jgi:hypothetical protein
MRRKVNGSSTHVAILLAANPLSATASATHGTGFQVVLFGRIFPHRLPQLLPGSLEREGKLFTGEESSVGDLLFESVRRVDCQCCYSGVFQPTSSG